MLNKKSTSPLDYELKKVGELVQLTLSELRTLISTLLENKPDAGPFEVGDDVLHGKYKNKKAKIKKIFKDDKDHVAVELEPDPKGRKKNVEMGLYKVWPADKND